MANAVSDSSVLIHLSAIGRLSLLPRFFEVVFVPDAVWTETVLQGKHHPVATTIADAAHTGWLRRRPVGTPSWATMLRQNLHEGEVEAISLALEVQPAVLLMDESDGRTAARQLGLPTMGAVGLLLRAKREGLLPMVRPELAALVRSGFHLAPAFVDPIIRAAGE
jgi:predicted nucleic acid-binding protein